MKLTIITINYNNAPGLQKTIESVMRQTSSDFEYIIIDGASTDGSLSISESVIRKLEIVAQQKSIHTGNTPYKILSEPDTGIYNAMNKGIRMAKGEYLHFLNSGDWLVEERVVEQMLQKLEYLQQRAKRGNMKENSIDVLVGNVLQIRSDGKVRKTAQPRQAVSLFTFYRGTIQHTSAYIRRELFEKNGLYDENLKIVADWKWYLQVAGLQKANVQFADIYVTYFDMNGISSTNQQLDKAERRKVLEALVPAPILDDYDKYAFDIEQMERLKKHPFIYKLVWFTERILFKFEKWNLKHSSWK